MDTDFFKKIDTIFLVDNIGMKKNGITTSVIRKTKLMEDKWGYHPIILVAEYSPDLIWVQIDLKYSEDSSDKLVLNKSSHLVSVYDYFQKRTLQDTSVHTYSMDEENFTYEKVDENIYKVYQDGFLIRKEYFSVIKDRIKMIDRYDENGQLDKKVFFDNFGNISKIRIYDKFNKNYYPTEIFFTTDKKRCIEASYTFNSNKGLDKANELKKLELYNSNGDLLKEFANDGELAAYFIETVVMVNPEKYYMLVCESGMHSNALVSILKPNAFKVQVVHSVFLDDSYNLKSSPQSFYKYMCENNSKFDGIVFLTRGERQDFIKKYGDLKNTFVISHPYYEEIIKEDFSLRNSKRGVIVSRFDNLKRINLSIDIFKKVVDEIPDAELWIYGFGLEEKNYKDQIKELGLENNIFLKGFTSTPTLEFRRAVFSMMTSIAEGFGLTLMESIVNGCPAFSFDIKYGPSDIIKDNETGYLITDSKRGSFVKGDRSSYKAAEKDIDIFAKKIINFLQDEELQKTFSENCYEDAPRFSVDIFLEKWYELMETLYRKR